MGKGEDGERGMGRGVRGEERIVRGGDWEKGEGRIGKG